MQSLPRFYLLFFSFYLFHAAQGQAISFSVKNESLEKVFLLIEQQSYYHFFYTTEHMAKAKPLTLSVANESLQEVLEKCFLGQPLDYKVDEKSIIVREKMIAFSKRPLIGKVTDEEGSPVPGLTVSITTPLLQTRTDAAGKFQFDDVPIGASGEISGAEIELLSFSSGTQSHIDLVIKKRLTTLDETIIIAYGKTTKRYSTETVTSIKSSELSRHPVSNPLAVLSGLVSGLQVTPQSGVPGANYTVRIRGRNSIANGNDPLYIVDGVPFPGVTLNGMFGGAAGTFASPLDNLNPADIESIEILKDAAATAIYGSRGANGVIIITTKNGKNGKTSFSLRAYTGAGAVSKRYDLLGTPAYLAMRRESFANDNIIPAMNNAPDLVLWDTTRYTDWQHFIFGGAMQVTDINPTISGGNEFTQFTSGIGYHKETTVFPGNFYAEKFSGSLAVNHASENRKLQVGVTGSFVLNSNVMPQQDLMSYITLAPNAPSLYTSEGKLNWENSTWSNPMSETFKKFRNITDNYIFSAHASYRLPIGFMLKVNSGYNHIQLKEHSVNPSKAQNPLQPVTAVASFGQRSIRSLIHEPQVSWMRRVKSSEIDVLIGASVQETIQQSLYQSGSGYSSDELLRSLRSAPTIITSGDEFIKYHYSALFSRLNYNYRKKYIASLAIRRDGSSRYGPENRFSTFGSAAFAWILTKEKFLKNKFLDFAKLKISAGITGNDQIGDYRYLDLYSAYTYPYQNSSTFYPTQLYNPNFGWERVTKWEAGWESVLLKGRLTFNVNYYYNTTSNQLVNYTLPAQSGFTGIVKNIPATIRNTGLEIEISGSILQGKKFNWDVSFNLTFPSNRLLSFENLASSTYATTYAIGQPLSIVKRLKYTGIEPANGIYTFADINGDGKFTLADDYTTVIDLSQRFFGGMQHIFHIGSFSGSLLFQFASQPHVLNEVSRFNRPGLMANQPMVVLDHWQKPGDDAAFQRYAVTHSQASTAFNNFKQSDAMYSDGSFVRLKNMFLSYDLFNESNRFKVLRACKLTIQGQNLFTITRCKNLDPETISALPPITVVTGGIQFTL